jgi:hypothetical protein
LMLVAITGPSIKRGGQFPSLPDYHTRKLA